MAVPSRSRPQMGTKAPSVRLGRQEQPRQTGGRNRLGTVAERDIEAGPIEPTGQNLDSRSGLFGGVMAKFGIGGQSNTRAAHENTVETSPQIPQSGDPSILPTASRFSPSTTTASQQQQPLPPPPTFADRVKLRTHAIAKRVGYFYNGPNGGYDDSEPYDEATRQAEEKARYDRQVIDLLDVIDPEVSALSTLSDLQNSLFVPNLGRFVDRASYVRLAKSTDLPLGEKDENQDIERAQGLRHRFPFIFRKRHLPSPSTTSNASTITPTPPRPGTKTEPDPDADDNASIVDRGEYLVLPSGLVDDWNSWSEQDKKELDDCVRYLLESKKWRFKRSMRGFKNYVRTPLGAFVTIYASLLTLFGAAWVLLLIGWLSAGDRQDYFIEICDEILVALFCVVGIGLAPFRAVDTYHMIYIAKYHRKTLRLYKERNIPAPDDENDLPRLSTEPTEEGKIRPPVLSVEEQAMLIHHQTRFSRSHTFYRPHETATHKAFPLDLLIVVVCLLDFHSLFQITLGSTTWSISYHKHFKHILTSIILSFSISCNITGGIVIAVGNRRSRKTEVVEERLRRAVTEEAVKLREERKQKEERERQMKEIEGRVGENGHAK